MLHQQRKTALSIGSCTPSYRTKTCPLGFCINLPIYSFPCSMAPYPPGALPRGTRLGLCYSSPPPTNYQTSALNLLASEQLVQCKNALHSIYRLEVLRYDLLLSFSFS